MAIISKPSSDSFRENFDKVFGRKPYEASKPQEPASNSDKCQHRFVAHLGKCALLCVKCNKVEEL